MSEQKLRRLEWLRERGEFLVRSLTGKEEIGIPASAMLAEIEELEAVNDELVALAKSMAGSNGRLAVFQPKHGRF